MKFYAVGTYRNDTIFSSALAFIIRSGYVLFESGHSLRDRLRAVECPRDIIGDMGGQTRQVSVMPVVTAMA